VSSCRFRYQFGSASPVQSMVRASWWAPEREGDGGKSAQSHSDGDFWRSDTVGRLFETDGRLDCILGHSTGRSGLNRGAGRTGAIPHFSHVLCYAVAKTGLMKTSYLVESYCSAIALKNEN